MQTCMRKKLALSKEACCTLSVPPPPFGMFTAILGWIIWICIVTLTDICACAGQIMDGCVFWNMDTRVIISLVYCYWNWWFWNSKKERAKLVGAHVKRSRSHPQGAIQKGFHLRSRASPSTTNLNYVSSWACCESRIKSNCDFLTGEGQGVTLIFDLCFRCRWKTSALCVKCFQVQHIALISPVPDEKNYYTLGSELCIINHNYEWPLYTAWPKC